MQKTPLYGLDRELAEKQAGKYDPEREQQAQRWIEAVLKEPVFAPGVDLHAGLKDGLVLGRCVNV